MIHDVPLNNILKIYQNPLNFLCEGFLSTQNIYTYFEANRGLPGFIVSERCNKDIIWILVWLTQGGSMEVPFRIKITETDGRI